jgi:PAS domain-containing protein
MFFTGTASKNHLSTINDISTKSRSLIQSRLKEVEEVDKQLKQVLSETKKLTISIREKLETKLKINRSLLKILCQNLQDGVILVNFTGSIVEINQSCKDIFGISRDDLINKDLSYLTSKLRMKKTDGCLFDLSTNFFEALSHNIFYRLVNDETNVDIESYFRDIMPQNETKLHSNFNNEEREFTISLSILDNDPDDIDDITYIIVFKEVLDDR